MNLNEINLEEAKKDTLSTGFESGGYTAEITEAVVFKHETSSFQMLKLKAKINGIERRIDMFLSTKDGKAGVDSSRVAQLIHLLKVDPKSFTEENHEWDNHFIIPQLKGEVGVLIEFKPSYACKPNAKGNQYPEYRAIQFFDHKTGKTITELSENTQAEAIEKTAEALREKVYKEIPNANKESDFNQNANVIEDDLPY